MPYELRNDKKHDGQWNEYVLTSPLKVFLHLESLSVLLFQLSDN